MSVKEKVLQILTDIYVQNNDGIFKKLIRDITEDKLLDNEYVGIRIKFLNLYYKKHSIEINLEDIEYVINYLESIEIKQKLIQ